MWGTFLLNLILAPLGLDLNQWGITPRTFHGLIGIFISPVLHMNFAHIVGNSTSLLTFLALLIATQPKTWVYIPILWVSSGCLLWIFGPSNTTIVGASGLIYACAAFLIVVGFVEKDFLSAILGIFCSFLYGASLISGIVGTGHTTISWQAHALGAIAGVLVATALPYIAKIRKQEQPVP